jgi:hypothetical protein
MRAGGTRSFPATETCAAGMERLQLVLSATLLRAQLFISSGFVPKVFARCTVAPRRSIDWRRLWWLFRVKLVAS